MPAGKDPRRPDQDFASEIDKLLKKLPHADPSLSGGEAPSAAGPVGATRAPLPGAAVSSGAEPIDRKTLLAVWGRLTLVVVFGLALTQWPYQRDCGWGLTWYCAAVAMFVIAAGWCAMVTWEDRVGLGHILSLVACFWGIVLSADVLLPRLEYSVDRATWRCSAPTAMVPAAVIPAAPVVTAPLVDSVAVEMQDSLPR